MIVTHPQVLRLEWRTGPALAILLVVIPLTAARPVMGVHQYVMGDAHVPVEVLHEPLLAPAELLRGGISGTVEMLAVDHQASQPLALRVLGELHIQPPLVRGLVFESAGMMKRQGIIKVARQ